MMRCKICKWKINSELKFETEEYNKKEKAETTEKNIFEREREEESRLK